MAGSEQHITLSPEQQPAEREINCDRDTLSTPQSYRLLSSEAFFRKHLFPTAHPVPKHLYWAFLLSQTTNYFPQWEQIESIWDPSCLPCLIPAHVTNYLCCLFLCSPQPGPIPILSSPFANSLLYICSVQELKNPAQKLLAFQEAMQCEQGFLQVAFTSCLLPNPADESTHLPFSFGFSFYNNLQQMFDVSLSTN